MRKRRSILVLVGGAILLALLAAAMPKMVQESLPIDFTYPWDSSSSEVVNPEPGSALATLNELEVKGRAPKTGYTRAQFGSGWATINGCSTREIILYRDLTNVSLSDECTVASGTLNDTYTNQIIEFSRTDSSVVQIDHVVALSDAWQKGAQLLTADQREQLANDPLELIAVSGKANQEKSDSDAATWLPSNKAFRCEYVARQIAVKKKYILWVTEAEKTAIQTVLKECPTQSLPL
ncbi:MAG: HNH endonuclease family protein [Patescibacteria group bacterium]